MFKKDAEIMKDNGEKSSKRDVYLRDGIVDLFTMEFFIY